MSMSWGGEEIFVNVCNHMLYAAYRVRVSAEAES